MRKYVILLLFILFALVRVHAVGWTPTDAGLVVNMEQGERFLLSVWVDINNNKAEDPGEEFFVSNYTRYTGGYYNYGSGTYMKLLPATEITEMNEWSVGAPLARGNKALGGIAYTIWNDGKTLKTSDSFKFLGDLTDNYADAKACDVVFVIPTERGVPVVSRTPGPNPTSFDPNGTLGRGTDPFNGRMGTGFLGMTYREVYMLQIPKANSPQSYTNAGLVTFNTTLSTWKLTSGAGDIVKGKAAYAYADKKHDPTPRTIFRLYLLDNPMSSCSSYFFATDEQDYKRYRMNENNPQKSTDSTAIKKIYTMDRMTCMSRQGSTQYYRTDLMRVPEPDSTYYYVGYNNAYPRYVNCRYSVCRVHSRLRRELGDEWWWIRHQRWIIWTCGSSRQAISVRSAPVRTCKCARMRIVPFGHAKRCGISQMPMRDCRSRQRCSPVRSIVRPMRE